MLPYLLGTDPLSIRMPTMKIRSIGVTLALLATLSGCASTGGGSSDGRDPDVITQEELRQQPQFTGLQMIRQFRPNWLNDRGGSINVFGEEDIANPRGIRLLGQVCLQRQRRPAELHLEFAGRMLQRLGAPPTKSHSGTGPGEGLDQMPSQAGRTADDQRHLVMPEAQCVVPCGKCLYSRGIRRRRSC